MLDELSRHAPDVERVAYLDGVRVPVSTPDDPDSGVEALLCAEAVATTVTVPDADLHSGFFTVSAAAMSAAGQHLREWGLARLVQVHTHGTDWVDHSSTDDRDAYSQRVGSVSVVLAEHARGQHGLERAAVHVRDRTGWVRLRTQDIASVLRILPSAVDLRDPSCLKSATDTKGQPAAISPPRTKHRRWPFMSWFRRT
jgi:hypothetical protein